MKDCNICKMIEYWESPDRDITNIQFWIDKANFYKNLYQKIEQVTGEICDRCGWAMKFPDEPCRCELEKELNYYKALAESEGD